MADPDSAVDRSVVPLFASAYFPARLWAYTNFHCNLSCDYCAVNSSPRARRRTMSPERFTALVDEAVAEGFVELYVTGGEPFLHPDIVELLAYAAERLATVVLTNAMLLGARRSDSLRRLAGTGRLVVQTSLDGSQAAIHDAHRGRGSWERATAGIRQAGAAGLDVRVAMTETAANSGDIPALAELVRSLGVPDRRFAVRPMLRRGLSSEGVDIDGDSTVPEITVTTDGYHWHPAGADLEASPDMFVAPAERSLAEVKRLVTERFFAARLADGSLPQPYRCAI
ncbi:MAG: radical SAM protein [Acidobacteriota bacterium]|nr:radical SAM protein [Acidobacteriota bacterium]